MFLAKQPCLSDVRQLGSLVLEVDWVGVLVLYDLMLLTNLASKSLQVCQHLLLVVTES